MKIFDKYFTLLQTPEMDNIEFVFEHEGNPYTVSIKKGIENDKIKTILGEE